MADVGDDEVGGDDRDDDGQGERGEFAAGDGAEAAEDRPKGVGAHAAEIGFAAVFGLFAPLADEADERAEAGAGEDGAEQRG